MIKIGFDISQIAHPGGVSTYTDNLAKNLTLLPDLDLKFFYTSLRKPYTGELPFVKQFRLPPSLVEVLVNNFRFPAIETFIGNISVLHSSDWIQPPTRAKKITTYHDVIPIKYPQWSKPKIVRVHKKRLELVEKEIDLVIAVSQSTKNDLLECTRLPEKKIRVIYEGVSSNFFPRSAQEIEEFRVQYKLPRKFVLAIGGIGLRRNLDRVKKAVKDYPLIITRKDLPDLNADQMPLLYCAATTLFYPSLYEGFGLPIIESFACGTPVVTSNLSSMPEIGQEAAIYVNPEDVEDMTKKIRMLMEDRELRQRLAKRGLERAEGFSWEKCAEETVKLYKDLI